MQGCSLEHKGLKPREAHRLGQARQCKVAQLVARERELLELRQTASAARHGDRAEPAVAELIVAERQPRDLRECTALDKLRDQTALYCIDGLTAPHQAAARASSDEAKGGAAARQHRPHHAVVPLELLHRAGESTPQRATSGYQRRQVHRREELA